MISGLDQIKNIFVSQPLPNHFFFIEIHYLQTCESAGRVFRESPEIKLKIYGDLIQSICSCTSKDFRFFRDLQKLQRFKTKIRETF
jgi:hypothetical protein